MNEFEKWKKAVNRTNEIRGKLTELEDELDSVTKTLRARIEITNDEIDCAIEDEEDTHKAWVTVLQKRELNKPDETGKFVLWLVGADGAGFAYDQDFWFGISNEIHDKTYIFESRHEAANSITNFDHCYGLSFLEDVKIKSIKPVFETRVIKYEAE